jgi:hypothetical protein
MLNFSRFTIALLPPIQEKIKFFFEGFCQPHLISYIFNGLKTGWRGTGCHPAPIAGSVAEGSCLASGSWCGDAAPPIFVSCHQACLALQYPLNRPIGKL